MTAKPKVVIEVKLDEDGNPDITVFSDTPLDLEIVDWESEKRNPNTSTIQTERHLFHITTGMEVQ